ncbi:MAG: hypothetical protein H0U85_07285 [Gemmatimonadales bacterium]|nr:hypothetical protein [Gemmatimonadales bacterium]
MQLQKDMPDHHDADLILKLYELRREEVMRASRQALGAQYWPMSAEEAVAPTRPDHPLNAALRQVAGYWEMVFGMARHGIVHAGYLVENNGEGLFLYMRVEPFLDDIRRATAPTAFQHTEWAATHTDVGRAMMESLRTRFAARLGGTARP